MPLEAASFIHQLDAANPAGPDRLAQGDDHIRLIKAALKATFPNLTGAVTLTQAQINGLIGTVVPVGLIAPFYGSVAPAGWAICNGQTVSLSDGTGTITTPDLRGRVVQGLPSTDPATPVGALSGQTNRTVTSTAAGEHSHLISVNTGGAHSHEGTVGNTTLTVEQMPRHQHGSGVSEDASQINTISAYGSKASPPTTKSPESGSGAAGSFTPLTEEVGGSQPHTHTLGITSSGAHSHEAIALGATGHTHQATVDVTQPTMSLHYIMKV